MDSKEASEVWKLILDSLKDGKDFFQDQIPLVVSELIVWHRCWYISGFVVFVVALVVGVYLFRKHFSEIKGWDDEHKIAFFIVVGPLTCLDIFAICHTFYYASMVWFAPRVYLIEYLSSLIKKHT